MTERTFTEHETSQIAVAAALNALALFEQRPQVQKGGYSIAEAAKFLGCSKSTVSRMKLAHNAAGKISYEALVAARASK